jgi:hypothetical protein
MITALAFFCEVAISSNLSSNIDCKCTAKIVTKKPKLLKSKFQQILKKCKKVKINLDINFFLLNICAQKVHRLLTMLSRKVEGIDPVKP